jgi:hypothetical protein
VINSENSQGRAETIRIIISETDWLEKRELDGDADTWLHQRLVFSVDFEGRTLFPAYQFDELGQWLNFRSAPTSGAMMQRSRCDLRRSIGSLTFRRAESAWL